MEAEYIRLGREIALSSFEDFIDLICPEFIISDHHKRMIEVCEKTVTTPSAKAFIAVAPRHSKSYMVSNLLPVYLMTKYPNYHVMVASYGGELSLELGRRTKQIFSSDRYRMFFPDVGMSDDSSSKTRFHLNNGSSFFAVGVGGSMVGKSASLLILDDAYSGYQQARSKSYQTALRDWFGGSFYTRRLSGAPLICVNTMWTVNDIALELSKAEPDSWNVLRMPAIQADGTALWPQMFPIDELTRIKNSPTMGTRRFEAIYQQNPTPDEGTIFQRAWFNNRYNSRPPVFDFTCLSVDLPFDDGVKASYAVFQVWGRIGVQKYLLDQIRTRAGFPKQLELLDEILGKWPNLNAKWIEKKANGAAMIATVKTKFPGILPVEPVGSKPLRAEAVSPQFEAGNIWFPSDELAPWMGEYVEEMISATRDGEGEFWDQIDATTQAIYKMTARKGYDWSPVSITGQSKWLDNRTS